MAMILSALLQRSEGHRYDTGEAPLRTTDWKPKPMEEIVGRVSAPPLVPDSALGAATREQAQAPGLPPRPRRPWESPLQGLSDQDWREIFRGINQGTFYGTPSYQREGALIRGNRAAFIENQAGADVLNLAVWDKVGLDRAAQDTLDRLNAKIARIQAEAPARPEAGQSLTFPDRVEQAEYRAGQVPFALLRGATKPMGRVPDVAPLARTVHAATDLRGVYQRYQELVDAGSDPKRAARRAVREFGRF